MQEKKKIESDNSNPLKVIDILEGLSNFPNGVSLNELCIFTGLNKSSTFRLLNALIDRSYVIKDDVKKTYKLSYKIMSFSSTLLDTLEIKKIARPDLKELGQLTRETIHLIYRDGNEGLYVDKVDTPDVVGLRSQLGKRIPLYCTSGGKVLLAYSDISFKLRYFESVKLEKFTENTITDPESLMIELSRIKEQGYALDREEHHSDINCISVPLFNKSGIIEAAISIAAPAYRFSIDLAKSFIPALKTASSNITSKLPY